ncbi:MAG: hypothetical protein ACRC2R_02560 [Xenococcaceae cyanobacterium]
MLQLNRLPSKVTRELLKLPLLDLLSLHSYQQALKYYQPYLPSLSKTELELVDCLNHTGVFITSLQNLNTPYDFKLIKAVRQLVKELKTLPTEGQNVVALPSFAIMNYPEIFLWGLQENFLDAIENYLGVPVRYHGAGIRRELADGRATDVRQWHIDPEDRRMVKIIIYLNEVDIDGGPYEYIPLSLSSLCTQALKYSSGFVSDRLMAETLPADYWQACLGDFGTAIFTDTCRVFHRAKPPVSKDRYSLSFTYTSRKPLAFRYEKFHFSSDCWWQIEEKLSDRQKESIVYTRE